MLAEIQWTNPNEVDLAKNIGMLYFISVVDGTTRIEYRYVGQTKRGKSRLREYKNNVRRIFEGQPRRTTKGQGKYRPVHLALAKACQYGWEYKFYPLENVNVEDINIIEQLRISELDCNLNVAWSWSVDRYNEICMLDIPGK